MSDKQTKGSKVSATRKTPPYIAREYKGEVKIGINGQPWVSIPNKNMNYSWQTYNGTSHNKYIERMIEEGDTPKSSNDLDVVPSKSSKTSVKSTKSTAVTKKVKTVPNCDSDKSKKVKIEKDKPEKKAPSKKDVDVTPVNKKSTTKAAPKYTKKEDKSGRVMYYNATGRRTAKKNVPEQYL